MQVILIGAQSTGKTSVMNALPDNLKQYGIREVIRNMTANNPSIHINGDGDEWSQNQFFFEYLYLFAKYPDYISDRGLLDVCAYTLWLSRQGKVDHSVFEKQFHILCDWIKNHPTVDHVYFPIRFPVVDDGYRDSNEENRVAVDQALTDVIEELIKLDLWKGYTICDGTVEERVGHLKSIIEANED